MEIELKSYIVAFIDVLGFSAMVQHDCESPNDNQLYIQELYAVHLHTKELKKTIEGLQLIQFSDSVVLAIPYSRDNYIRLLEIISNYQFELLSSGILCRGGISYGKHFSTEDFLFSNGMIDAYRIESTVASTPRIVVSQELMDLVYPSNPIPPEAHLAREQDGLWFVKYLQGDTAAKNWSAICKAITEDLSDNPSVRSKQIWLIDYYNHQFPHSKHNDIHRFECITPVHECE